ncbi:MULTISPECIES: hypothetical protein [Sorangium]|uniref:Ricin B lectin domain-containing protein n=1 Tax=Sorangium cellulosum TaxID=56 RepID=A0A4P2QHJ5_SORCE|nr:MULTISPECIES: hypothetical protein [Sorangium]AUX29028.1 uncharacterized protein SOCE836_011130 [Sorangium cellulosum]WCQ88418.1 hypothetical protein NQZ70_01094 [Sorangium sp. Soce836]
MSLKHLPYTSTAIASILFLGAAGSAHAAVYPASSSSGGPGVSGCTGGANCTNESWGVDLNDNTGFAWSVAGGAGGNADLYVKIAVLSQTRAMSLWLNGSQIAVITSTATESPRPTGKELGPFPVTLQAGNNTVELRDTQGTAEFDVHSLRVEPTNAGDDEFEIGLWRLMSRADRGTLSRNAITGQLVGADYSGDDHQHWRLVGVGASKYQFFHEETGQCLVASSGTTVLGGCSGSAAEWTVETLRARTVERPALYRLRSNGNSCAIPNGGAQPTLGTCNDSARWYLEPVGFGERLASVEFDFHGLLLVKPYTDVPGVTQGSLSTSVVDAVQFAFEDRVAYWMDLITDGRVAWHGSSVVSNDPITSLSGSGNDNYLPAAIHLQQDVQSFVPRGQYDTVQVFFTPGNSKPGGWGWGPGSSYESNYTMWTTVNGKNTVASDWLSTVNSEPAEVFIHEPIHGLDGFFEELGIPLPEGLLDGGSAPNRYASSGIGGRSWLHWYRDYWLGTVIASDDTYRGFGPRAFAQITPRDYALSPAVDEYKIVQHTSGKCFVPEGGATKPDNDTPLVLSSSCSTLASSFRVLASGLLKHVPSGLCIHPNQGTAYNGVALILNPSCAPEARLSFDVTSGGSLQNSETGRCVHPLGGSATPAEGTNLIFHDGCDEERLRFDLVLQ